MTTDVPTRVLDSLRARCLALPDAYEEDAWVGTRWCVRKKTFAHVLMVVDGRPASYAKAAGTDGPVCVLTFRSTEDPSALGPKFFRAVWGTNWGADVVGLVLGGRIPWKPIGELLTESYRLMAPAKLADQV